MKRYIFAFILTLATLLAYAQSDDVGITIGGDVYGGGKQGAVGIGNASNGVTKDTPTKDVDLISADTNVTGVTITTEAKVRTVFGGGMNGRCYGQTNVTVEGGTVGADKWNGTLHGGIFGAGDGAAAYVFGKKNTVTIKGGTIYNNIYGGGNEADLMGSTAVILQDGNLYGSVFGGARMANIFGHSYVNLDGENVPDGKTLIVSSVFGGNDISGTIATSPQWAWTQPDMPFTPKLELAGEIGKIIDKTWSAFIRSTYPKTGENAAVTRNNVFVGTLYGGGNGDYAYTADNKLTLIDTPAEGDNAATSKEFSNLSKPELEKTYLNLEGGTFGNVYGGGNNATINGSTDILVWNAHFDAGNNNAPVMATIPKSRISEMGLLESMFTIDGDNATALYQFNNVFGGNNTADMAIRPNWYLAQGTFNNIYSGGNKGSMTHPEGVLVSVGSRSVYANNVYGGCRLADVRPMDNGIDVSSIPEQAIPSLHVTYAADGSPTGIQKNMFSFAKDLAARVYITQGHINNVYGGNDISGKVYMGSNVVIEGAISGNVYGGGNGSYAYTDNAEIAKLPEYKDLYYNPTSASSSIDALNAYRPHVENTMLHIFGSEDQKPTIDDGADGTVTTASATAQPVIVTGGIFCGGNSATIDGSDPKAVFNIGKNVIINAVYLGSNGENMVTKEMFTKYKSTVNGQPFSTIDLTDRNTLAKYMQGCAVNIRPTITYDWMASEDPHTYIGSIYGGGNVGSVTFDKAISLDVPAGLKLYDRVVGGCNAADITAREGINAGYEGGFSVANTGTDKDKPKLTINMDAYLEPRELIVTRKDGFLSSAKLDWDKRIYFKAASEAIDFNATEGVKDKFTTLYGANVFGGCYSSGHIAGDVTINVTRDLISPAVLSMVKDHAGDLLNGKTKEEEFEKMGNYVFAKTMTIYGGGYGEPTSIRGDVRVNLKENARVLNVMGGADYGMIGTTKKDGWHEEKAGNVYVTAAQGLKDYTDEGDGFPYNCMQIYGGAFFGTIYGHTELKLNGGTFLNAFGGSCDADIADYTSVYLGNSSTVGTGYPYIRGYVFGGNDFGGVIGREGSEESSARVAGEGFTEGGNLLLGYHDFAGRAGQTVRTTRYLEYNSGRIGLDPKGTSSLYGGSYGSYDYSKWFKKTNPRGNVTSVDYPPTNREHKKPVVSEYIPTKDGFFVTNTYVNACCQSTNKEKDYIARAIFGGGRGIMDKLGIVDAKQTYVYLHGANWASRGGNLSYDIYGGGYYSVVESTKVDLESGCTHVVYGGSYGTSAKNLNTDALKTISYNCSRTEVNLYAGMDNADMSIFGGGGYAGSTDTYVNLYGGKAKNVYGGSYNEGYCQHTHILVPDATNTVTGTASTASVNAIFGGGYGNDVTLPCDEDDTNVDWKSSDAYVADMIYGGNNAKRAAEQTVININAPVRTSASGSYVNICGAGNGECTVAGFTTINLNDGARVNNVYGGGRDGKVFGYYKNISGATTYYGDGGQNYLSWYSASPYHNEGSWEGSALYRELTPTAGTNLHGCYKRLGTKGNYTFEACKSDETANGTTTYYQKYGNTNITIGQGATVTNVFGGGLGSKATVTGSTRSHLHGGTITNNYFGGGESGNIVYQQVEEKANDGTDEVTLVTYTEQQRDGSTVTTADFPLSQKGNIYTYCCLWGGEANSVYGGGLDGHVGTNHDDLTGETRIEIGEMDVTADHCAGVPNVRRSVYGGGYRGAVNGTAKIQMLRGYIGYDYQPSLGKTAENAFDANFSPNVNIQGDTRQLLKESGNIFGGGYGEGATTDHTIVNMYDGTIRNSLYGGGEIASVGVAELSTIDMADRTKIPKITTAGSTQVNLYGGLVRNNVFGGGRGYAIDAYGNTQSGEIGYSDGYTFGKTFINIYRGTIGTDETLAEGNGNVFGGGNIGYIYGADYRAKNTSGAFKGYYNTTKHADGYYYNTGDELMSEDSKVVVTPWARVMKNSITIDGNTYYTNDYVPYEILNKNTQWEADGPLGNLDQQGVIIRNAVFAGGNVSAGSDKVYANAYTIYGNSTASVVDCLNKDLVTIGNDDVGGLYGDGNLTFVDGYRELNITNYGTDYYSLGNELSINEYQKLNDRERAYFELKYVCQKTFTIGGKTYTKDEKITGSDYKNLPEQFKTNEYWVLAGFCTLYAGRLLNTIQRADFCGVFGSRMVLKGAQDRVPSVVDYNKYTLNRVGELSLNQVHHGMALNGGSNGCYFGVYSIVNYLGALTSDVDFKTAVRKTDSQAYPGDGTTTYEGWKKANLNSRTRNNGNSKNKVALASGVWLELVKKTAESNADKDVYENYTYKKGDKIYGPITGVVELDLINASTGEGGGYVYALNEHGTRSASGNKHPTLTAANTDAVSYKAFAYSAMDSSTKMETSGNFINGTKRIIDDCYPNNGAWVGEGASTAHYWFIRGDYYVYDQYISAYTGAAQSYAESVSIPLTITAEAQGRLKLLNVQENFNANWTDEQYEALDAKYKLDGDPTVIIINGKSYSKNSPISYWDYSRLTTAEQAFFTTGTYVCTTAIGSYTKGQVLTSEEYTTANNWATGKYLVEYDIESKGYKAGDVITAEQYNALANNEKSSCQLAKDCFNVTNAVNTANGFLLTYDWNNPTVWSDYYIKPDSQSTSDMITETTKNADKTKYSDYVLSPTYKCTLDGNHIFGQKDYSEGDLIDYTLYQQQPVSASSYTSDTQAAFEKAYVAKDACKISVGGNDYYYVKGSAISSTFYNSLTEAQKASFDAGYTCIHTFQTSDAKYYVNGDVITSTEYNAMTLENKSQLFSPVYICTSTGAWGGKLYTGGKNYVALDVCNLTKSERANFQYNIDALDLMIAESEEYNLSDITHYVTSSAYSGLPNYTARHTNLYAAETPIDYKATYSSETPLASVNLGTINNGQEITREQFENSLVNERANYAVIDATNSGDYYIVKSEFWIGEKWYGVGTVIEHAAYDMFSAENKAKIEAVAIQNAGTYYYCKQNYTAATAIASPVKGSDVAVNGNVPVGTILNQTSYEALKNEQKDFEVTGIIPTETSTLYVARETDINQINEDKIITVVYEYSYVEMNDNGTAYENIKERHIVNVNIHFESGVPTVGELLEPNAVLPGNAVSLNQPSVTKGAYEILGGGWEIFSNEKDAQTHKNGTEYTNNNTKMYWYQNGYHVAYYAKSYLGKTYSNPVKITVANHHRMADVMAKNASTNVAGDNDGDGVADYMYLNEAAKDDDLRDSKVYIKDAAELDNMKAFFELTKAGGDTFGAVKNCNRIDFIADGDIDYAAGTTDPSDSSATPRTWTSIGDADNCFSGDFHGDGHTVSGLDHSLFGSLCGDVYNTGVTGSFTGSGITDAGDGSVHNCWVVTTGSVQNASGISSTAIHGGTGTVTNSYYYNNYGTREGAIQKPLTDFLNGEVAYNLNSYYLAKRYYDDPSNASLLSGEGNTYTYWSPQPDGAIGTAPLTSSYPSGYTKYVESRYGNEDFIYADGVIPQTANIRKHLSTYSPVFPDDYIFFGQNLSYGIVQGGGEYVDQPQAVHRQTDLTDEAKNTKLLATDLTQSNRVYRAPAYYKSKAMATAYYNRYAAFKDAWTLATTTSTAPDGTTSTVADNIYGATGEQSIYKDLTAIDFTGNGDNTATDGTDQSAFYKKFLDYDGLAGYTTDGLTRNLLVYGDPSGDANSYSILNTALPEATLTVGSEYKEVAIAVDAYQVKGHLVDKTDAGFKATRNHYLVDKENFNCPVSYTFDGDYRMWYQREPDNYVDASTGWEAISLPFTADLVSTQTKGEITHFYSKGSKFNKGYDSGHEYWLREFKGQGTEPAAPEANTFYAAFNYPTAAGETKEDSNKFLWDYYYSHDDNSSSTDNVDKDANGDDYPDEDDATYKYYKDTRTYANYPLYAAAVPYIIGFPCSRYYEFDLSGTFEPQNRQNVIDRLDAQTVSFVSVAGSVIDVSDDELSRSVVKEKGFAYTPAYTDASIPSDSYVLNADGSSFKLTTADQTAVPFRPYFTSVSSSGAKTRAGQRVKSIAITSVNFNKGLDDEMKATGNLIIYPIRSALVVESECVDEQAVTITSVGGVTITRFTISNGERIVTQVTPGVYIVNNKKYLVK